MSELWKRIFFPRSDPLPGAYSGGGSGKKGTCPPDYEGHSPPPRIFEEGKNKGRKREKDER